VRSDHTTREDSDMSKPRTHITRELDRRTGDGIEVRLLWRHNHGHVTVAVTDTKTGEAFELPAREGERAPNVFHHPYAYAARPQHRRVPVAASHSRTRSRSAGSCCSAVARRTCSAAAGS
jgi:hypothetical protein